MTENSRTPKKIRHHLKHFLIPHVHNDYKPHIFRETSVSILLGTTLFLFGLSVGSAYIIQGTEIGKSIISKVLIDLTNKNRLENNLQSLTENPKLYTAALLKAKDMLGNQYFAHESPAGLTPWHFLEVAKYEYTYAGENLAINHVDNEQTETAWMNSPLHRKNILDSNFQEVGISAYSGDYNGRNTIFVVQMFGTPAEKYETLALATENTKEVEENNVEKINTVSSTEKDIVKVATKEVLAKIPESKVENSIIKTNQDLKNISSSTISTTTNTFTTTVNISTGTVSLSSSSSSSLKVEGAANKNYSKIYERLIYNGSNYVQNMLQILFVIIFIATLTDVLIEIKRQHVRHIAYAVLLLIILTTLMYLNKNYFELNFVLF